MSVTTMRVTRQVSLLGVGYQHIFEIDSDGVNKKGKGIPAAKSGTLTVRGSNTAGSVTLATGHGFTTGVVFDLFWSGGRRHMVTAGTVAGDVVPFSLGSGDNLPVLTTVVTAMVPVTEPYSQDGDNVLSIIASMGTGPKHGFVRLLDGADAELLDIELTDDELSYLWFDDTGLNNPMMIANPIAGEIVANVLFSHSHTAAVDMVAAIQYP